jgi:hypothetical protein
VQSLCTNFPDPAKSEVDVQSQRRLDLDIAIIYSEIKAKAKLPLVLSKNIGWVNSRGNGLGPKFPDNLCLDSGGSKQ